MESQNHQNIDFDHSESVSPHHNEGPPKTEVSKAKKILEELEKAAKEGKGAAQLDGRMIDAASARMAENIVNIDNLINK